MAVVKGNLCQIHVDALHDEKVKVRAAYARKIEAWNKYVTSPVDRARLGRTYEEAANQFDNRVYWLVQTFQQMKAHDRYDYPLTCWQF